MMAMDYFASQIKALIVAENRMVSVRIMGERVVWCNKKPPWQVVFCKERRQIIVDLFDFGFFVDDMLTRHWIKFFDFHFFGHIAFVFVGCVEVTSTGSRFEFDFIAHDGSP
jgi:hypothetical protein